jgi:hypothetical protein
MNSKYSVNRTSSATPPKSPQLSGADRGQQARKANRVAKLANINPINRLILTTFLSTTTSIKT